MSSSFNKSDQPGTQKLLFEGAMNTRLSFKRQKDMKSNTLLHDSAISNFHDYRKCDKSSAESKRYLGCAMTRSVNTPKLDGGHFLTPRNEITGEDILHSTVRKHRSSAQESIRSDKCNTAFSSTASDSEASSARKAVAVKIVERASEDVRNRPASIRLCRLKPCASYAPSNTTLESATAKSSRRKDLDPSPRRGTTMWLESTDPACRRASHSRFDAPPLHRDAERASAAKPGFYQEDLPDIYERVGRAIDRACAAADSGLPLVKTAVMDLEAAFSPPAGSARARAPARHLVKWRLRVPPVAEGGIPSSRLGLASLLDLHGRLRREKERFCSLNTSLPPAYVLSTCTTDDQSLTRIILCFASRVRLSPLHRLTAARPEQARLWRTTAAQRSCNPRSTTSVGATRTPLPHKEACGSCWPRTRRPRPMRHAT
jgi:hypothetical protein